MVVLCIVVCVDTISDDGSLIGMAYRKEVEGECDFPFLPVCLTGNIPVATISSGTDNITAYITLKYPRFLIVKGES